MDTSKIDKLLESKSAEDWELAIELLEGDSFTDLQRIEYLGKIVQNSGNILGERDLKLLSTWLKFLKSYNDKTIYYLKSKLWISKDH